MLLSYSFRFFSHWSPSAFQLLLTLLIRYRSCAPCLDLEVDTPIFLLAIKRTILVLDHTFFFCIRGYYSLWQNFPVHFYSKKGYSPPHVPMHYCSGIQVDLSGFHSLLLTGSHLLSFPLPTKMLHFRRLLHITVLSQTPGSKAACAYPGHFVAYHVTLRAQA